MKPDLVKADRSGATVKITKEALSELGAVRRPGRA